MSEKQHICGVCGGLADPITSYESSYRNLLYSLLACRGCGLHFWIPLEAPDPSYYEGEELSIYEEFHTGRKDLDVRYRKFLREVGPVTGKRILDVGCSDGLFLEKLQSMGNQVCGFDLDTRSVAVAKSRGLLEVYCQETETFLSESREAGRQFDIITLFDVLEHLTDPLNTLKKLKDLLSRGGELFGTVPNRKRFLADQMEIDRPPHHFFRFDETSLGYLLRKAGFDPRTIVAFDYGYSLGTIIDLSVKSVRGRSRSRIHRSGTRRDTAINKLKHGSMHLLLSALKPLSAAAEYSFRRGFKLYFRAKIWPLRVFF